VPEDSIGLRAILREDFGIHYHQWWNPGFHVIAVSRLFQYRSRYPRPRRLAIGALCRTLHSVQVCVYGVDVGLETSIGRRVRFGHATSVTIHPNAQLGNDVLVRQGVTIGAYADGVGVPVLEDGVELGAGAVLMGPITVGQGAKIGPNAVVSRNVPAGAVVMCDPPRMIAPKREKAI
jgi:serine O-acetyltransferase